MKRELLLGVATLLFAVCFATSATAIASVEMGINGEVRVKTEQVWKKTGVMITDSVLAYGDVWKQAYAMPGTVVPVKTHEVIVRDGLFHTKKMIVIDDGIVYDVEFKNIHMAYDTIVTTRTIFNPYLIFWILSVFAMTVAVWLLKRKVENITLVLAILASVALAVALPVALAFDLAFDLVIVFALVAAAFSLAVLAADCKPKTLWLFVGMYYFSMVVGLVLFVLS